MATKCDVIYTVAYVWHVHNYAYNIFSFFDCASFAVPGAPSFRQTILRRKSLKPSLSELFPR
jgi:hypothetical protein